MSSIVETPKKKGKKSKVIDPVQATEEHLEEPVIETKEVKKNPKTVDTDFIIPIAHIKKYISRCRMNKNINEYIEIVKACAENNPPGKLENNLNEDILKRIENYYAQLSVKVKDEKTELTEYERALRALSIFKYKFNGQAFSVVTYVINLIAKEITLHTLENCITMKRRSLHPKCIPWTALSNQMMSGTYINTKVVYDTVAKSIDSVENLETDEDTESDIEDKHDELLLKSDEDEEGSVSDDILQKYQVKHFLHKLARHLIAQDERFTGFKVGKLYLAKVNDIIINVMERYILIIKEGLLDIVTNKTISDNIFIAVTKIMVEDNLFAVKANNAVLYNLIDNKLETLKKLDGDKKKEKKEKKLETAK